MTNYDKVVKGIERHFDGKATCQGCLYLDTWPCLDAILKDALTLIKAQRKELRYLQRSKNWAPKEDRHDQV